MDRIALVVICIWLYLSGGLVVLLAWGDLEDRHRKDALRLIAWPFVVTWTVITLAIDKRATLAEFVRNIPYIVWRLLGGPKRKR